MREKREPQTVVFECRERQFLVHAGPGGGSYVIECFPNGVRITREMFGSEQQAEAIAAAHELALAYEQTTADYVQICVTVNGHKTNCPLCHMGMGRKAHAFGHIIGGYFEMWGYEPCVALAASLVMQRGSFFHYIT